jgi:hypothetical protein
MDLEDLLSDEIEVARAAEQLAKHLVDTVSAPASRDAPYRWHR